MEPAQTLLIVDGDAESRERLAGALAAYRVLTAEDAAQALAHLGATPVDLILADYRLDDCSGVDLLHQCEARSPATKRLLITTHSLLPKIVHEIVHARATKLVQSVIQKSTRPENVQSLVAEALGHAAETSQPEDENGPHVFGWRELEELLLWTATEVTQVRSVVIRELHADIPELQLQFVLPANDEYETFRREVVKEWLWPIKPKDWPIGGPARDHPVVALLGALTPDHEVYAHRLLDGDTYVYLALLPWRREPRVTAVLGICSPHPTERLRQLILEAHHFAVEEVAELPLPVLPQRSDSTAPGHTVMEYDWIVTDSYVGPDRRSEPTSLFNRFVGVGRRKWVASGLRVSGRPFVDRFLSYVWIYALAYLGLSLLDSAFTYWFVRHGRVGELNPLLRPLVIGNPWLFLLIKNALSVAAFFTVARFQLFRRGRIVLSVVLAVYALLDGYWLWLVIAR